MQGSSSGGSRRVTVAYLLAFFTWMFCVGLFYPQATPVAVNYFASRIEGKEIDCNAYSLDDRPKACVAGATAAVKWIAGAAFASNAVLGFIMVPLTGWISDRCGRRPVLLTGSVLAILPMAWVSWYTVHPSAAFTPYFVLDSARRAVEPMAAVSSAMADVVPAGGRVSIFRDLLVATSAAFMVAAALGTVLGAAVVARAACGLLVANCGMMWFFLPETLSSSARTQANAAADISNGLGAVKGVILGTVSALRLPFRSRIALSHTVLMAVTGTVFECLHDVLFSYLLLTLNFGHRENSFVVLVQAVSGLVSQLLVLPTLTRFLSPQVVVCFAIVCSTSEMVMLTIAPRVGKPMVLVAAAIGAVSSIAAPVLAALESESVPASQQGEVQGALYGVRSLARGLGPLMFSAIFTFFTQQQHYHPVAPLVVAAVLLTASFGLALSLVERVRAAPENGGYTLLGNGGLGARHAAHHADANGAEYTDGQGGGALEGVVGGMHAAQELASTSSNAGHGTGVSGCL